MTYEECEKYYEFYIANENEKHTNILKAFAVYNLNSVALARRGTRRQIESFINDLHKQNNEKENNIEDQFKGLDFGK